MRYIVGEQALSYIIGIGCIAAGLFMAATFWGMLILGKRADEQDARDREWMVCQGCGQEPALLPSMYCEACQPMEKYRTGPGYSRGPVCEGCGREPADPPSRLCPGCQAYQEHQR